MITVQLKTETRMRTPMVILPSVVAFSNAKRRAPLAKKGEIEIINFVPGRGFAYKGIIFPISLPWKQRTVTFMCRKCDEDLEIDYSITNDGPNCNTTKCLCVVWCSSR